jgi:hypothetical protein
MNGLRLARRRTAAVVATVVLGLAGLPAQATSLGPVDQQLATVADGWPSTEQTVRACFDRSAGGLAQGVIPGVDRWGGVAIPFMGSASRYTGRPLTLNIRDGSPDGTVLGSASAVYQLSTDVTWTTFVFDPPVDVPVGQVVYLEITPLDDLYWRISEIDDPSVDHYESCWGTWDRWTSVDLAFITYGVVADPDSDGDGVPDAQDAFPSDPSEWADHDGDGLGDNGDPDTVSDAVDALPDEAITAPGIRQAVRSRLEGIETDIQAGSSRDDVRQLENLARRFDGCGTLPDHNDWVIDCDVQLDIRTLLDTLIATL